MGWRRLVSIQEVGDKGFEGEGRRSRDQTNVERMWRLTGVRRDGREGALMASEISFKGN